MSGISGFSLKGRALLPVVQGGMGVGVSAHRLAGTVAGEGGVGTLSSVDLRRHHPDLMLATGRSRDKQAIDAARLGAVAVLAGPRELRAQGSAALVHGGAPVPH